MARKLIDWPLVQQYYNNNHTVADCAVQFNISEAAVLKASARGVFVTRSKQDNQIAKKILIVDERITALRDLFNAGASVRDLKAAGYSIIEYNYAVTTNAITPRSLSDAGKISRQLKPRSPHTEETRQRISKKMSINNKGGRCKWYEVSGQQVQGTWERNVAEKLDELGVRWEKLKVHRHTFEYEMDGQVRHYTPDIFLPDANVYLEIKGRWWGRDKEKMDLVIAAYPATRFVILEKPQYDRFMGGELVW